MGFILVIISVLMNWVGIDVKNDWFKTRKISDIDKYLFIQKELKGGISYIAKRYAKANNKRMNDYDPKKSLTFKIDLDMIVCVVGQWVGIFLMVDLSG